MKHLRAHICAGWLIAATNVAAVAQAQPAPQAPAGDAVPVTPDNFNRAETDMIFAGSEKRQGLGRFLHYREPISIDFPVVRPNRDTLYSLSVFDLNAGPVTITLPNAGQRFVSMQVIDEDHYTPEVIYGVRWMRSPHLADTSCKEWSRAGVEKDDRPQVQPRAMFARRPAAVIFTPRAKR